MRTLSPLGRISASSLSNRTSFDDDATTCSPRAYGVGSASGKRYGLEDDELTYDAHTLMYVCTH